MDLFSWRLREEIKAMEQNDREGFMRFMAKGRSLVNCAIEGDLDGFQKIFAEETKLKNLMFWHI